MEKKKETSKKLGKNRETFSEKIGTELDVCIMWKMWK